MSQRESVNPRKLDNKLIQNFTKLGRRMLKDIFHNSNYYFSTIAIILSDSGLPVQAEHDSTNQT